MTEPITHYLLVNMNGVYTKTAEYFVERGGLVEPWGRAWEPISAASLYGARAIGIRLRRARFPDAHQTLGECGEAPEDYWPEAAGA